MDRSKKSTANFLQEQLKQKSATRLVNSPHAKYTSRGQLMCIVCGCHIKSAIVWQAHIAKKSHTENLKKLQQHQQLLNSSVNNQKRKASFTPAAAIPSKKFATESIVNPVKPKGILKSIKSYESSDSDEDAPEQHLGLNSEKSSESPPQSTDVKEELDYDIKDDNLEKMDEGDPSKYYASDKDKAQAVDQPDEEQLPEGFFDDPVADAKARKVEYVDKDEAEWSAFMKDVSAAETTSRQIIADDTEEAAKRNQILQAEEQMELYQRVIKFDQARQHAPHPSSSSDPVAETKFSDDEDDLMAFNWRNKRCRI